MGRPGAARWGAALVALNGAPTRGETVAALLLGLAAFLIVVGPSPLDPTNIAWLSERDAATNYLGWAFFRAAPWGWPPAANPAYGMDVAGSVMMADANPLFALPIKLLSPLLPTPFQYFGPWLLLCFLLQALFAMRIAARISCHPEQRLAIMLLLLFAPFFLIRIATPAIFHMTLCGQWQILAALWLCLSPDRPRRALAWAALLAIAVVTHPYLFAMAAALRLADLAHALLSGRTPPAHVAGGAALSVAAALIAAKASGVFWLAGAGAVSPHAGIRDGFGLYKASLLSPIDPQGWSRLLPDLPSEPGEIEGFAFLGLGVLLLAVAAIGLLRRAWPQVRIGREHWPLLAVLIGFGLFALTPYLGFGLHEKHIWWPAPLIELGNLFRSSGRFVWPVGYAAMAAIAWVVARGATRRTGSALLIAAALVQIADGSAGWRTYAQTFERRGRDWPTALASPFWERAGRRYRAVRMVAPKKGPDYYRDVSGWALRHGMATEVVYLARYDDRVLGDIARRRAAALRAGRLARDTLWIMDGIAPDRIARMPRGKGDFVGTVDGLPVYAPGWAD